MNTSTSLSRTNLRTSISWESNDVRLSSLFVHCEGSFYAFAVTEQLQVVPTAPGLTRYKCETVVWALPLALQHTKRPILESKLFSPRNDEVRHLLFHPQRIQGTFSAPSPHRRSYRFRFNLTCFLESDFCPSSFRVEFNENFFFDDFN